MIAQELSKEIIERRERRLITEAKVYPKNHPTASGLEECSRRMVYEITHWKLRPPAEPYVQARMEEGKKQENRIIQELLDLGFTITENNPPPFEIRDRQGRLILRGMIDGKCLWQDRKIPFEIKSVDKNIYSVLKDISDFNKYFWMKKYILQMTAYLYANNEESGLFILCDMAGHWKIFIATLNLETMEKILQQCEYVVDRVEKGTLPDFCKDTSLCQKCWALGRVCTPALDFGEGLQIIDDPEMEVILEKREELKPQAKEYEEIDNHIKGYFKNKPNSICGNFEITGKNITKKLPAQEAREITYWQSKIVKVETPPVAK